MSRRVTLRAPPVGISLRLDARVPLAVVVLVAASVAVAVLNLMLGEYPLGPLDVIASLLGVGPEDASLIVTGLRLPRTLVALGVGVALGVAGAVLQELTRNSLAAPEIIGVTAGANLAAVTLLLLLPSVPVTVLPAAALVGALVATAIVYALAWRTGSDPTRLLLVGIGVTAAAQAVVIAIVTSAPVFHALQAVVWMAGSVYGRGWPDVQALGMWLGVLLPAAWLLAARLDPLQLGDAVAGGLGVKVERSRALLLLVAAALASVAVATAGPIAFVGLLAPHIARRLVGPSAHGLLVTAAPVGALLVIAADVLGRTLAAPIEIPAGVLTPLVGVPYLVYLLYRGEVAL